ncbi:RND transporter, HAE1/HME family, permease protein [Fusobacterium gonidiaformans 3-1-5R]|uniref:RND transporter, HAE1/HME family, permease protein n=1 Tax=Fusobacterium gonidiaformans 3-1-5R TaxID=469605 RepID=E5BFU6_9FUSO|nr:efflux RND transporter permease subunit [Fusobacterium gonidiaformans]EFS20977.1 RND transporter, HAE1/HME family, permease protein [Fusobacterium gonidiaformans 3-1-5R]
MVEYFLKNRIVTLVLTLLILLGGILSYFKLGKLEDPEFKVKEALVVTLYPGASPHQVELEVTDKLEQKIREMPHVEYIDSTSKAGYSEIRVKIEESIPSKEVEQYWDILRKKVADSKLYLPSTAISPIVLDDYGDVYGMFFAITSEGYSKEELNRYSKYIKRELESIQGVSKAVLYGKADSVVEIVIDRSKMANLGINEKMIYTAMLQQNIPTPAHNIEQGTRYLRFQLHSNFQSIEDIENLVIFSKPDLLKMLTGAGGDTLFLKDIAEIKKSSSNPSSNMMRFCGKMSIGLQLSPESGTNVVKTGEKIDKRLEEISSSLPIGIEVHKIYYQPELVSNAISQFVYNLIASVAVVIGVLLFTMGMRSGLIIGSGLVLSILGTFIYMLFVKMDLQRVSLGAFIIAMGMLVDNSIVIVDGTLNALENKMERYEAVTLPTKKIALPLFGATFVAIAAFLPMYLMKSSIGEYISSLFWVIAISLGLSWIFSMTQTPLLCYLYLNDPGQQKVSKKRRKFYWILRKWMNKILHFRKVSLLILLGSFCFIILLSFGISTSFFPNSDKKGFVLNIWTPEGSNLEYTNQISKILEKEIAKNKQVENYTTFVGASPSRYYVATIPELPTTSLAQIIVNVDKLSTIEDLEKSLTNFTWENLPDVQIQVKRYANGIPTKYPLQLRITGSDPKILRDLARKVEKELYEIPGAKNVNVDWKEKVLTMVPNLDEQKERKHAVSTFDIASALNRLGNGNQVGVFHEGVEDLPIVIREKSGGQQVNSNNLEQLPIFGVGMQSLPLGEFIKGTDLVWEDPMILRHNGKRAIQVQADVETGIQVEKIRSILAEKIKDISLPEGYSLEWNGEYYEQNKNIAKVLSYVPVQFMIMFVACLLLFATLTDPFIIFVVLPLSLIGIVPGLLLTGRPFGFMAIIGMVSLSGMMIKNSIVLLDEIRYQKLHTDKTEFDAVVDASLSRVRAVSLAAGTTIFGMFPLMFDPLYGEMAITIIFGLAASTILTLFVVPLLYVSIHKIYKNKK